MTYRTRHVDDDSEERIVYWTPHNSVGEWISQVIAANCLDGRREAVEPELWRF